MREEVRGGNRREMREPVAILFPHSNISDDGVDVCVAIVRGPNVLKKVHRRGAGRGGAESHLQDLDVED